MIRRILLVLLAGAAVVLVPWTTYLAGSLPDQHDTGQWRLAWVGFDCALLCCFAAGAWLGVHRHRAAPAMLTATAVLLCCDAWFDVVLDWAQPDRATSVLMAAFVEVPLAVVLVLRAKQLLVGGMTTRQLTARDLEVRADESCQRLLRVLDDSGPARPAAVAAALGRGEAEVTAALRGLAHAGWVRRNRDGRWRSSGPLDLRLPSLDDADDNDRSRVAAYLESKFDRERHLLTWAARHREDFGSWGKGERASAHLTQAELDRFNAEYHELVTRYCLLRPAPASGTREIAVRFYAFPAPTGPAPDPELTTRGEAPGVSPAGG